MPAVEEGWAGDDQADAPVRHTGPSRIAAQEADRPLRERAARRPVFLDLAREGRCIHLALADRPRFILRAPPPGYSVGPTVNRGMEFLQPRFVAFVGGSNGSDVLIPDHARRADRLFWPRRDRLPATLEKQPGSGLDFEL